jgi:hypothetical protein
MSPATTRFWDMSLKLKNSDTSAWLRLRRGRIHGQRGIEKVWNLATSPAVVEHS